MQFINNKLAGIFKRAPATPSRTVPSPLKKTSLPAEVTIISQEQSHSKIRSNKSIKSAEHERPLSNHALHVSLIWFEPTFYMRDDFQQVFHRLNVEYQNVNVFTDIDACVGSLTEIAPDSTAYLLIPGMWTMDLLKYLQLPSAWKTSIKEIFVYSSSPQQYNFLQEQNSCIRKIYANIEDVWNVIHQYIDKRCEVLRFYDQRAVRDLSSDDTIAEFIWFMALKDALFQLPRDEKGKDEMVNVCHRFYTNNLAQLALIEEFKRNYQPEDAPRWFSRSSFLYKLVNRALRTQDVEQLYVFRYFIRDLSFWLSREFKKILARRKKFFLYRGATLSQDDYQSLDRGKLLAPNGFFSTSRDINVAKLFIGSSRSDTVRVLYKIKCDMACYSQQEINELVAFADISENSHMPHEREVLFDLGATFEIEDIKQRSKKKDYITICLTPSCEGAHILYEFRQECRNEIKNSSSALTFGALLFKTNKYAAAQRYFEQLLDAPNNENISEIYHYLGWTHLEQDDYGQAIVNFERAHDVILENDGISRAKVLNSIGKALVDKGFIQESLSYYKRALDLRVACLNPEHEDVANSYANVGHLYNLAGNHNLAMEYYNKSVRTDTASVKSLNRANYTETNEEVDSINSSISGSYSFDGLHQSTKYSSISGSFYQMGYIQCEMGESVSGLHNMKRSLKIDRYSSFRSAPELLGSFHSRGNVTPLVDPDTKVIHYRLRCLENIKRKPLKSDVEIAEALEKVGHAYTANEKFDEALNYYLSALQQREKQGQRSKYSLQVARTLNYIGDTHRSLHQFEQALACYKRAITIYKHFPLETNRDRLRTLDKINKITQEIPSKTDVIVATKILRNRTTISSLRSALNTKNNKKNVKSHQNPPRVEKFSFLTYF